MKPVLCIDRKITEHPVDARQAAFVHRFAQGCDGALVSYQQALEHPIDQPWHIRGMKFAVAIQTAWRTGRTFYYTDNGYIGNNQNKKTWFRIIKNHVHQIQPIIGRSGDRLARCEYQLKKFSAGRKILLAPPSAKSLSLWGMDAGLWVAQTVEDIKRYTDRPIEIRMKRPRTERMKDDTIEEALANDVHCLVTYNSVAACEAIMLGKPAVVLGPNAARYVANDSLEQIENLYFPSDDERMAWLRHLSYSQFTFDEMSDGTAWNILNS